MRGSRDEKGSGGRIGGRVRRVRGGEWRGGRDGEEGAGKGRGKRVEKRG